ncbi:GerAB/ArcD/ProY family transporter [Brevibacillus choshinensis]|uniref:GerAB/ArcD/ProY family transporter n=1 Tax=Brevibacillus choshinensis TaxID=54911 RepID=UPI002E212F0D|nr:GerAB/ArcD/ProY family transporter [Brevibacillus choshinensis]MED4780633.1 GerAB/ArcD/ProY family transporter [Brevibacillus choshinensis]
MIHKQVINHRQIAWLVGSVLMTGMMISFFHTIVEVAKMDAWFSQLLPVCYAIMIAYVLSELSRAYPGKNMFEIIFIVFGKWVGGMVNLILLIYFWLIICLDIKGVSKFFQTTLLPQTPIEITLIVFVLLIMYYGKTSLEVAARVNEMYFPAFFLLSMTMYFLLGNEYSIERVEPILSSSLNRIAISNFLPIGIYGDILLFGAFLHASTHPRLFFAAMKHGVLIVGFSVTMLLLILLGVMGYTIASRLNFPMFILVQQIHVTDFLDRVEIAMIGLWFPAFAIKVIVAYQAFLVGVGSFGGQAHYPVYNFPTGWLMVVSSLLIFQRIPDLEMFLSYSLPAIVMALQIPLMFILYIKARMNRKMDTQVSILEGTKLYRYYRYSVWIGATSLLTSMVTVLIGDLYLNKSEIGGIITASSFCFFFFIALIASYAEMQALNHGKQKLGKSKASGSFRQ